MFVIKRVFVYSLNKRNIHLKHLAKELLIFNLRSLNAYFTQQDCNYKKEHSINFLLYES